MNSGGGMSGMMGMSDMAVEDEFSYLAIMIPHHEEAITAAEVLKAGTDRPEMREFAQSIIDTQTREVTQMRSWLATWYPGRDTSVDYTPMMRDLTELQGDALDRAFLDEVSEQIVVPLSPEHYPSLVRFTAEHVMQPGYDFGDSFEAGLGYILDGVERAAATPQP